MEIRVSFFLNDKIVAAGDELIDAMELSGIDDPMFKGWDYYDSEKDAGYIQMLMHADTVTINGGDFKVVNRHVRASKPHALWITVEPIKEHKETYFKLI